MLVDQLLDLAHLRLDAIAGLHDLFDLLLDILALLATLLLVLSCVLLGGSGLGLVATFAGN